MKEVPWGKEQHGQKHRGRVVYQRQIDSSDLGEPVPLE